jgi:DNA replicative helicase MCM subunit Mcm2 (Cdc46/Mcm family)
MKIGEIGVQHKDKELKVAGFIGRVDDIVPKVNVAKWICNRCEDEAIVSGDIYRQEKTPEPMKCRSCGSKKDFRFDIETTDFINTQIVMLVEKDRSHKIEMMLVDKQVNTLKEDKHYTLMVEPLIIQKGKKFLILLKLNEVLEDKKK